MALTHDKMGWEATMKPVKKHTVFFASAMGTFTLVIGLLLHESLAGKDLDFVSWLILVSAYLLVGFFLRLWILKNIDDQGRWK